METQYHLEIYGWAWGGFKATYSYIVTAENAEALRTGAIDPERCAGDFEHVIDWRLVRENCTYERTASPPITRRIDTFLTLRGFRNGMSPRRFYRLSNA